MEQSIEELVRKVISGDQNALTDLYNKTSSKAFYLALELVKDEDMAQDILQDSYVKAFMNLGTLSDPAKFQNWLNSIVVNTSKNYLKKKNPVLFSQLATKDDNGDDQEVDFEDESEEFSPEATVDYSETKRLVQEMIDNLPDAQRTVIVLHYMEDYSVKQIADIMECPESTVKSRLNYGRRQIEKDVLELEKQGVKLYCVPLVPFLIWMFHTQPLMSTISVVASSAVSAGTAVGSTVGSTVGTGTTLGAAVSTGSTVSSTVAAGGAATAAGTVDTTVTAATGLSLAAKIGIAAAVIICVGAGAAIGITSAARSNSNKAVESEIVGVDEVSEIIGIHPDSEEAVSGAMLTDREQAVLEGLYAAIKAQDYSTAAGLIFMDYDTLYALEQKYYPGQLIAFDGRNLTDSFEGEVLVIQTESSIYEDNALADWSLNDYTLYTLRCYFGTFKDGVPDGKVVGLKAEYDSYYRDNLYVDRYGETHKPLDHIIVSETTYINGEASMPVTVQNWEYFNPTGQDGLEGSYGLLAATAIGSYMADTERNNKATGDFELIIPPQGSLYYVQVVMAENGAEWIDAEEDVVFRFNADRDLLYEYPTFSLLDESGVYHWRYSGILEVAGIDRDIPLWKGLAPAHESGTETTLPSGGYIDVSNGISVDSTEGTDKNNATAGGSENIDNGVPASGEDIVYDVHNLSQEQSDMLAPMDSLAYIMAYGITYKGKVYAPADPDFVWDALTFWACQYSPLMDDGTGRLTHTGSAISISKDLLEEYTTILFSGSTYDGKLPEWTGTGLTSHWEADNLIINGGDRGDESWRISSWVEHPDGTVTAETQILDGDGEELYGIYGFELIPNTAANADFSYKITNAQIVQEYTYPDFPQVDSDGNIVERNSGGDYILDESSNRYYTESELNSLTKDELRLARNEIYARHGRIFDSTDLDSYFRSKSWYNPTTSASQFSESVLNTYEKANIAAIQALEAKK